MIYSEVVHKLKFNTFVVSEGPQNKETRRVHWEEVV